MVLRLLHLVEVVAVVMAYLPLVLLVVGPPFLYFFLVFLHDYGDVGE